MGADTVTAFEQAFADWLGVRHAFAFWKGRVAMYAILRAMGVGEGDEVILPGYTCVMTINPVKYLGARPIYADIDPVTYNLRPDELAAKITPRTCAIVAQHTYGYPCRMDAIMGLADRHGIPVIEDCCLAMGSTYKGKLCGTFGLATYWSFQWNKPFTTGIGGMATTDSPELAGKIEQVCREELVQPSRKAALMLSLQRLVHRALIGSRTATVARLLYRWLGRKGLVIASTSMREYTPTKPEQFCMAMSVGQARAGLKQLHRVDRNITHRRQMQRLYDQLLREAGWDVPEIPGQMAPVLVRYPLRVADRSLAARLALRRMVELGTWFESPLHILPVSLEVYDYQQGMCPEGERAGREVVNLPTHVGVTDRIARKCVAFVNEIGPAGLDETTNCGAS